MTLSPETVDLSAVAGELSRAFGANPPTGFLLGRTAIRDAVTELLSCSQLEAEELVDTMVARSFLRYEGSPSDEIDRPDVWTFTLRPEP